MFEQLKNKGQLFQKGHLLFSENENSDEMYFIVDGAVEILKLTGEDETSLAIFRAGEILGEMAFFDNKPRSATARVLVDSHILIITRDLLEKELQALPTWFTVLLRIIITRLRNTNERLATFLLKDKMSQTSNSLMEIAKSYGQSHGNEVTVNLGVAQKFLANNLGITLAEANEGVSSLVRKNLAKVEGEEAGKKMLLIPDINKLQEFVSFLELKDKFCQETNADVKALLGSDKRLHMLNVILRVAQKIGYPRGMYLVLNYDNFCHELKNKAGMHSDFNEVLNTLSRLSYLVITEKETYLEKNSVEKIVHYSQLKNEFGGEEKSTPELVKKVQVDMPVPGEKPAPLAGGESYRIKRVSIEDLKPGMILAKAVLNNTDKVVLFEEGLQLTEATIAQITKIPHIFEVEIKDDYKYYQLGKE